MIPIKILWPLSIEEMSSGTPDQCDQGLLAGVTNAQQLKFALQLIQITVSAHVAILPRRRG